MLPYILFFLSIALACAVPVMAIIFVVRWIMRRKKWPFAIIACVCGVLSVVSFFGIGFAFYYGMTPEERAAYDESIAAEESRREESRLAEESRKEESRLAEESRREESRLAEESREEEKRKEEASKAAEEESRRAEEESRQAEQSREEETNSPKEESHKEESKVDDSYFDTSGEIENEVVDIDTSMLKVLMDAGYSIEHATQIEEILNTIGIESIEIDKMTGEAEKGLNAVVCYANNSTDSDKRFSFTTEDGVLFYAGFRGEDLYDIDQGGYLKNYADVHIPEKTVDMETYTTLQALAEIEVKKYLNYPNTASFGLLDWGIGRSDDNYKIIGKVTAKNAFGVKDEISFSVWFTKTDNGFVVDGVALDGVRVK